MSRERAALGFILFWAIGSIVGGSVGYSLGRFNPPTANPHMLYSRPMADNPFSCEPDCHCDSCCEGF